MPQFPGGANELAAFIAKNYEYPAEALKEGLEGKIMVAFVVDKKANKLEIKTAVEEAYNVAIESVRTMNYPIQRKSKFTKSGVVQATKAAYKKAIVQLVEGDSIDFYSNI